MNYILDRVERVVIPNTQRLIKAVRDSGGTIAYVRVGAARSDGSDAVPGFREIIKQCGAIDGSWACEVIDPLKPEPGDINLLKTGTGAFASSGLDLHLRHAGIENVCYTGVITDGCVLCSATSGFDLGYNGYLIEDATATMSEAADKAARDLMGMYLTTVVTTSDVIGLVEAGGS